LRRALVRGCAEGLGVASSIGSAYGCAVMRRNLPCRLRIGVALALFLAKMPGSAAAAGESDPVIVSAGTSTATASRITAAFERLSDFQRRKYGITPRAQLRGYVDEVVARDLALAERGKRVGMLESPRVRAQHQLVLAQALVEMLRKHVLRDNPVTDVDVKSYYDAHPELFKTPERIRILRLLADNEAEAQELLEKAKKLPTMDDWRNLVREKTKDRATSERGGDLGFVAADGTTDVPELEVDRALFAAAKEVKDGELVAHPVPEGKRFAVVWRRGTVAARSVELAQESERIRLVLLNDRIELELRDLRVKLRKEHLHEYHPEQVADREFPIAADPGAPDSNRGSTAAAPSSR
jgi:peptidyl-prolyl cis-trans isomerase C